MTTPLSKTTSGTELPPRTAAALLRYRVLAYTTGVLLVCLTVAVILKYTVGDGGATAVIGVAHGWIYVVYLLVSLDLAVKARWRPLPTVLVLLAGTIPLMSFVAEHRVTQRVRSRLPLDLFDWFLALLHVRRSAART